MKNKKETICLACSIFKNELALLKEKGEFGLNVLFQSSMLHMKPELLDERLRLAMTNLLDENKNVVLLYGDCCPHMNMIENEKATIRTKGINCIEILLGKETYRKLRKEGAFFFMPEWILRWEEVFKFELQLEDNIAKEFMQEFHTKIIYLNTGQIKIPYSQLKEIEKYTGLKVELMDADTSRLKDVLQRAIKQLNARE